MAIFNKLPTQLFLKIKDLEEFPNPFENHVHAIAKVAAEKLKEKLKLNPWNHPFRKTNKDGATGKMFGVLIVRKSNGDLGYIAGFSGKLADKNHQKGFVPPIFDVFKKEGFFRKEEAVISAINRQIDDIQSNKEYIKLKGSYNTEKNQLDEFILNSKKRLKSAKIKRDKQRELGANELSDVEFIRLQKGLSEQSKLDQLIFKKKVREKKEKLAQISTNIAIYENDIERLKTERALKSNILQSWIFEQFQFLNAEGQWKGLEAIFSSTVFKIPPSGAGECAGPKLLQYAYLKKWTPICMTEFWWGDSPTEELRSHNIHYPSCKGKCEPIFSHMLKGLKVSNITRKSIFIEKLDILYEDHDIIAINKPSGLLSVPGKTNLKNALELLKIQINNSELIPAHRLDMDTSGVLLFAKNKSSYKTIQNQFASRLVNKQYIAILSKTPAQKKGEINLPLMLDVLDRPRQKVNYEKGNEAITGYEVIQQNPDKTCKIRLCPQTGRTHQLRVHMAHMKGLNTPIKGDELYGIKSDRLYLHAESISFLHPTTNKRLFISVKPQF